AAAITLGFGATGVLVAALAGGGDASAFLALTGLALLLAAATLAIGSMLSACLRSRARVVGAAFAAWMFLVYVSDLGTIGLTVARSLAPGQVFALALLTPVQQARVLGTLALSDRAEVLGPVGLFGVETFGSQGLVVLLAGALAATALAGLAAGYAVFRKAVL